MHRRVGWILLLVAAAVIGGCQKEGGGGTPDDGPAPEPPPPTPSGEAVIIDHTCIDLARVPLAWIQQARSILRIGYGHTSHGSQIVTGIEAMRGEEGSAYFFTRSDWDLQPGFFLNDYCFTEAADLGGNGDLAWRDATLQVLRRPENDRNVVMWSWCGGVSDNSEHGIDTYLQAMSALEAAYPAIKFVYMTGHLDGSGATGNLHLRNEQIRAYCRANHKILFDFADIERYDPDGRSFLEAGATDGCDYQGGARNWVDEWLAAHPGHELAQAAAAICDSDCCAHSKGLNCVLKGRAFWWMMARLAGWPGPTAH